MSRMPSTRSHSTVHSMAVLTQSDPPSSGLFNPVFQDALKGLLQFQKDNGSPFSINPYPFFAYQSDSRPETLAFCLFQAWNISLLACILTYLRKSRITMQWKKSCFLEILSSDEIQIMGSTHWQAETLQSHQVSSGLPSFSTTSSWFSNFETNEPVIPLYF